MPPWPGKCFTVTATPAGAQAPCERAGRRGHVVGVAAERAVADDARRRPVVEVGHRREHPVDVDGRRQLAELLAGLLGGVLAAPGPGAGPRPTDCSSSPMELTRPPSSSTATSRSAPSRSRRPADQLLGLLLVGDVLVAQHHAADADVDQPSTSGSSAVVTPGQADDQHQAGAVLERRARAHRDRIGVADQRHGRARSARPADAARSQRDDAGDPDEEPRADHWHRPTAAAPARRGRAPACASVRTPRARHHATG